MYEQPSHINCSVTECFPAKLKWSLIEYVCQGNKVRSALAVLTTGSSVTLRSSYNKTSFLKYAVQSVDTQFVVSDKNSHLFQLGE